MTNLHEIEGIGEVYAQKLQDAGVSTMQSLLEKGSSPQGCQELANVTGISETRIQGWINRARLAQVKGIGEEYADLLLIAGVKSISNLAQKSSGALYEDLTLVNQEKKLVRKLPSQIQIEDWIIQARQLQKVRDETEDSQGDEETTGTLQSSVTQEKANFLKNAIQESIVHINNKKRQNRRRASYIKVTTILLTSVATVLLGLQVTGLEKTFKDIAFAMGAVVTLLNALEPFFNFRALWIEHEVALADLHRLQDEFDFYLAGMEPKELKLEELKGFNKRFGEIWGNLNQAWIGYRKSEMV
jgi:predicted flap endonuclease-1-like 5' DNA nuclease